EPIHPSWQMSGSINIEEATFHTPGDRLLVGCEAWDRFGLAAPERIEVTLLIRANPRHGPAVGGQREGKRINAFRRNSLRLSLGKVLNVEPGAVTGFAAGE